jgi:hypothetical protein
VLNVHVHQGFDTQTETLNALKQCGVPDAVILAMVKA